MNHLAWLTDIHLNFLRAPVLDAFFDTLVGTGAEAFAFTGDIAEAGDVTAHLHTIAVRVARPVYFVLGNHDFYRGSIASASERALVDAEQSVELFFRRGLSRGVSQFEFQVAPGGIVRHDFYS